MLGHLLGRPFLVSAVSSPTFGICFSVPISDNLSKGVDFFLRKLQRIKRALLRLSTLELQSRLITLPCTLLQVCTFKDRERREDNAGEEVRLDPGGRVAFKLPVCSWTADAHSDTLGGGR